jgi:hypothetical protein
MQQYNIWKMQSSFDNFLRTRKRIDNIKHKYECVNNEKVKLIQLNTELTVKLQENEEKKCNAIILVLLNVIDEKEKVIKSLSEQLSGLLANYNALKEKYRAFEAGQLTNKIEVSNTLPEQLKGFDNQIKRQTNLIYRLLHTTKSVIFVLKKAFKYLPCDSMLAYSASTKLLRKYAIKTLSKPKYWLSCYITGFPFSREIYWMIYFQYHISENVDQELTIDRKESLSKNDNCFEIEMSTINLLSYAGSDLFPDITAEQNAEFIQLSKSIIKVLKVTDYWLYKHGLFFFIAIISKSLNSKKPLIMKIIGELRKEPYLIDKLYSDDYYLVNLIVFQITHIMKERLCDYYYHLKGIGFQLNKILINWVLSMFCDRV